MTLFSETGTELTQAAVQAQLTAVPAPPSQFTVGANVYETYDDGDIHMHPLTANAQKRSMRKKRLKWAKGQVISSAELARAFPTPAVTGVSPATGPVAGGTVVTVTGSGLLTCTGVSFGGTAATAVTVVDDGTVKATTAGHAAGAVPAQVTTDSGTAASSGNAFTYQ